MSAPARNPGTSHFASAFALRALAESNPPQLAKRARRVAHADYSYFDALLAVGLLRGTAELLRWPTQRPTLA